MLVKYSKQGFTLVELIVVITILAILGTIGFLSFQGYSLSARDSIRVSDLNSISKSLELYRLQEGFYPAPSNLFQVSYSGSLAWNQGTFGEATRQKTQRINTIPVDPLTGNEYAYSVTNTNQEFELGAITENLISYNASQNNSNSLIPTNEVNAENSFFTYIKGNYNKQIVTVKDTVDINRLYILGVPTIITTEITDVTVQDILANQSFAIEGSKNLPSSYATTLPEGQTHTGSTNFTPGTVTLTAPLLYEGTVGDLNSEAERTQFGEDLVSYYGGSNITNQSPYNNISNIPTGEELSYVNTLIGTNTGGLPGDDIVVNVVSSSGGGSTALASNTNPKADPNCYTATIGTIGAWNGCDGLLIVDSGLLGDVVHYDRYGLNPVIVGGITFSTELPNGVFTGQITDMSWEFGNKSFNKDISYWDTSNVIDMSHMFSNSGIFNQNIGFWDVSSVENMEAMFRQAFDFNQDLPWDTSSVKNMKQVFYQAGAFNGDISGWDTSKVENMHNMFSQAGVFNGDISGWDTGGVISMSNMFRNAYEFNQNIGLWDTQNVANMDRMFHWASSYSYSLNCWNVSLIPSKPLNFDYATALDGDKLPVWGTDPACP